MCKNSREAYPFFDLKLYLSNHQHDQLHFLFSFFETAFFFIVTIPLLSSWWIINKPGKSYIYVVSSVFVLLFSGFDTFHVQGKMGMVYRTFAILILPCYLTLNNKMFDLTGKSMFQRGVNHACHCFDTHQLPAAMMLS